MTLRDKVITTALYGLVGFGLSVMAMLAWAGAPV